jgi:FkbM family methyltransferase
MHSERLMQDDTGSMSVMIRAAIWWAAHGNRGRGAVARAVGRWQSSDRSLFIKTRHGAALSVDYGNFDVYASIYNNGGCWDANVMNCCERVLRPGNVFFDIGSNAGVFALDFAKSISDLTVFAFEPQPSLAKHIRRSIDANQFDRVKVLEVLLGNKEGEASLFLTSHSIHASTIPRERRYRELRLPLRTLDGLITAGEVAPPDVIKIDVEGSELNVFQGAETMLQVHQPSIVFEADENMNRMGYTADDLFRLLTRAAPYTFFLIDDVGALAPARPPYPLGNFLALSPRHADRI